MNLTIIEEHDADSVTWGLSSAGPNPPAEEFLTVASHAEAVRIKDTADAGDIMPFLEAARAVVLSDEETNIRIERDIFGDDLMPDSVLDMVDALHAAHDALGVDYGRCIPEDKQVEWDALVKNWRRPSRPFSQDTPEGWAAMRELILTMHERSFTFHSGLSRAGMGAYATFEQGRKGPNGAGNAPTLPRAVADAALDTYADKVTVAGADAGKESKG